jgi:hypothetical protein
MLMRKLLSTLVLAAAFGVLAPAAWAESHVYNDLDFTVTVYWEAAGCAGVERPPGCGSSWNDQMTVCKWTELKPRYSDSYSFKGGTSGRKVWAIGCDHAGQVIHSSANTSNGGNKKRCAATKISDDLRLHCGYNEDEYNAMKPN